MYRNEVPVKDEKLNEFIVSGKLERIKRKLWQLVVRQNWSTQPSHYEPKVPITQHSITSETNIGSAITLSPEKSS